MIRIAKESDLPAVAAVYEAILDHEDATGLHYTGWKRGAYPTADTARNIFNAGTLYVGVDEDGTVWGSMNLNGVQLPEYKNGGWEKPPFLKRIKRPNGFRTQFSSQCSNASFPSHHCRTSVRGQHKCRLKA